MTENKRPEKGTPEYDLWTTAITIAAYAPLHQNPHVFGARVPWSQIDKLRDTLDALGVDWRKVKKETKR